MLYSICTAHSLLFAIRFCFSIPSFLFIRTLPLVRESDPFCHDTGSAVSKPSDLSHKSPAITACKTTAYKTAALQTHKSIVCKISTMQAFKSACLQTKTATCKTADVQICNKSANPVSDAGSPVRITASEESHLALKHKYSVMHLLYTARIFLSIHTVSHIHDC